jgi:hypothetical protein
MFKKPLLLAPVALLVLAVAVPTALAARRATSSERAAITKAVQTTPVADVDKLPTAQYRVTGTRITTLPSRREGAWAIAQITPRPQFRNTLQGATVVLVRPAGTRTWTAVDVGTSEVGCGIAPTKVLQDLYHTKGDVCPGNAGV